METHITCHAQMRMKQRGISSAFLTKILDNADVERASTDNCRLYRVSRTLARALRDDKLGRFAVIWSDDCGRVVTVVPIHSTRAGAPYCRKH